MYMSFGVREQVCFSDVTAQDKVELAHKRQDMSVRVHLQRVIQYLLLTSGGRVEWPF